MDQQVAVPLKCMYLSRLFPRIINLTDSLMEDRNTGIQRERERYLGDNQVKHRVFHRPSNDGVMRAE